MTLPILITAAVLFGVFIGVGLAALVVRRRRPEDKPPVEATPTPPATDEWTAAQLDRAAVAWAEAHGRPETAGLMADKLHLLHYLGSRRQAP